MICNMKYIMFLRTRIPRKDSDQTSHLRSPIRVFLGSLRIAKEPRSVLEQGDEYDQNAWLLI